MTLQGHPRSLISLNNDNQHGFKPPIFKAPPVTLNATDLDSDDMTGGGGFVAAARVTNDSIGDSICLHSRARLFAALTRLRNLFV